MRPPLPSFSFGGMRTLPESCVMSFDT
uniref:Uncharacterized protein n=1 Tax=Arundo donax TaxID=35708 RepID=A0A0A9BSS4_ARUDO